MAAPRVVAASKRVSVRVLRSMKSPCEDGVADGNSCHGSVKLAVFVHIQCRNEDAGKYVTVVADGVLLTGSGSQVVVRFCGVTGCAGRSRLELMLLEMPRPGSVLHRLVLNLTWPLDGRRCRWIRRSLRPRRPTSARLRTGGALGSCDVLVTPELVADVSTFRRRYAQDVRLNFVRRAACRKGRAPEQLRLPLGCPLEMLSRERRTRGPDGWGW